MYLYCFFSLYAIVILICNSCNFQYRDTVRQFIKGTDGFSGALAECLCGSPNLYQVIQAVNLTFVDLVKWSAMSIYLFGSPPFSFY